MPRKKTVIPDEEPLGVQASAETNGTESIEQFSEVASGEESASENIPTDGETPFNGLPADFPTGDELLGDVFPDGEAQSGDTPPDGEPPDTTETPFSGDMDGESAAAEDLPASFLPDNVPPNGDSPAGEESPSPDVDDAALFSQLQEGMKPESDDPEYGALLQELGETGYQEDSADEPLTLDPPPGKELPNAPLSSDELEVNMAGEETEPSPRPRGRPRERGAAEAAAPAADPRRDRVLTIEARDEVQTAEEREAIVWHEIQNAHWTRRILTGTLDGVERTESGLTVAVVNYKGFRVAIPVKEMLLFTGKVPSGADFQELMFRMRGILTARLGSEIDFIVKGHENKSRSVVASRRDAMYRKRQTFYLDKDERGEPMIYEGRVVQARVVAVAEKVVRVEVFGVECAILARGLSRAWVGNAAEHYHVGDRILVRVQKITGTTVEDLTITADVRSTSASTAADDLKKCVRQGRYAGRVTDVRGGVLYVRLNNGVNAIAHSCYDRRTPGKGDDVSFAVTRLDEAQGVAVGSITRIIKQNL